MWVRLFGKAGSLTRRNVVVEADYAGWDCFPLCFGESVKVFEGVGLEGLKIIGDGKICFYFVGGLLGLEEGKTCFVVVKNRVFYENTVESCGTF